jgi:hypothetical protein
MRQSNFALRLAPSLLEEARKLAQVKGVALNQLIDVAVAEKLSALRTVGILQLTPPPPSPPPPFRPAAESARA